MSSKRPTNVLLSLLWTKKYLAEVHRQFSDEQFYKNLRFGPNNEFYIKGVRSVIALLMSFVLPKLTNKTYQTFHQIAIGHPTEKNLRIPSIIFKFSQDRESPGDLKNMTNYLITPYQFMPSLWPWVYTTLYTKTPYDESNKVCQSFGNIELLKFCLLNHSTSLNILSSLIHVTTCRSVTRLWESK